MYDEFCFEEVFVISFVDVSILGIIEIEKILLIERVKFGKKFVNLYFL